MEDCNRLLSVNQITSRLQVFFFWWYFVIVCFVIFLFLLFIWFFFFFEVWVFISNLFLLFLVRLPPLSRLHNGSGRWLCTNFQNEYRRGMLKAQNAQCVQRVINVTVRSLMQNFLVILRSWLLACFKIKYSSSSKGRNLEQILQNLSAI